MEVPVAGILLIPVLAWAALGLAIAIALRQQRSSTLVHRLGAAFVTLWAFLATSALVWVVTNGGWSALVGLLRQPPTIISLSGTVVWLFGGLGALLVLCIAFSLNQIVARGFLKLYRSQPISWPSSLAESAGSTELLCIDLPHPDAFSYTLLSYHPGTGFTRREMVLISRPLLAILSPEEAETVLAHELGHVRDLDGRYLTFFRTFSQLMRWDPVLDYFSGLWSRREELRADRDAVRATGHPLALARALYKALEWGNPRSTVAAAFLGARGPRGRRHALERIQRLVHWAESGTIPEDGGA